jgi:CheY-like chemotaxis protein
MGEGEYTVLVADDSSDDVALLSRAIRQSERFRLLPVLCNGEQVVEYFEGKGTFHDRRSHPIPDVLLLDLRMPRKSGFEVLEHLRNKGVRPARLVVVLTSQAQPGDILRAYQLGAHCIDHKQPDFRPVLERIVRALIRQAEQPAKSSGSDVLPGNCSSASPGAC